MSNLPMAMGFRFLLSFHAILILMESYSYMEFHGGIQILTLLKLTLWEWKSLSWKIGMLRLILLVLNAGNEGMIHNNYQ